MNNSCHVGSMGRHLARRQILGIRPSYKMPVIGGRAWIGPVGDATISEPLSICANEP